MGDSNTTEGDGKKVFFLYPTPAVQNQVITELVQHEYEVYSVKNHVRLAKLLKKYADSVIFINIDEGMYEQDWEKWINSNTTEMPKLKIGIFTSNTNEELLEKFNNNRHVTCGVINSKFDMNKNIAKILDVLNKLNIKGRRKYLRASTENETTATLNMPHGGNYINGVIKDISTVGISCVFENDLELRKNSLFKDIQIRLQTMLLKAEAVVFGCHEINSQKKHVFLFTQRIDPDVRVKIRKYVQQNLQAKMDAEMN